MSEPLRYQQRREAELDQQRCVRVGVNRERVRQLERKALRMLGFPRRCEKFRAYHEEYLSTASVHHVGVRRYIETWESEVEREALRWAEKELG